MKTVGHRVLDVLALLWLAGMAIGFSVTAVTADSWFVHLVAGSIAIGSWLWLASYLRSLRWEEANAPHRVDDHARSHA